ncbi:MAG: DsrE family protein [Pseudomonadota bacterium]|nr:DsrE family protein [Pseudomonadota bacterium]
MKTLLIINDPPDDTEKCFNALRLGQAMQKTAGVELTVFLMGDAVLAARQSTSPSKIADLLNQIMGAKGNILLCGSCLDKHTMTEGDIIAGRRSTMPELAEATIKADKVLIF